MNKIPTIIAIGGGNVGNGDTLTIDQHIVKRTGKKTPQLLFIPTASSDSEPYVQAIIKTYGDLGCTVDTLLLIRENPSAKTIKEKIEKADIIYVGGGNTLKMMRLWRRLGVNKLLKKAWQKGTIMCGLSAGSICWFEYGHSDSMSFYNPDDWNYIRVKGLGFLKGTACPHFDGQTLGVKRKKHFQDMMKKVGGLGIGINNYCAVEYRDGKETVLRSKASGEAYILRKKGKQIIAESHE